MGDDDILLRLVKMLSSFFTEGIAVEEDLTFSLTSKFLRNIQDVLYNKQMILFARLESFFCGINCEAMIISTEIYLRHVVFACLQIKRENVFEGFLGVFALILLFSVETRFRTRMNFFNLVPDVFMVLYEYALKKPFLKCGGFRQFVKYINDPKYLDEKCIVRNVSDSYNHSASFSEISKYLKKKVFELMNGNEDLATSFGYREVTTHRLSFILANKILETTKIEQLPKPSDGLNANPPNLHPRKMIQKDKKPTIFGAIGNQSRNDSVGKKMDEKMKIPGRTTMVDDDGLLRLVKMLSEFFTEGIAVKEDLTYSLTSEFLRNIQDVLYTKQLVVFYRWECFFNIHSDTMFTSMEVFLRFMIYTCLQNNRVNLKSFECLLGVFALILSSSVETRFRTMMNFCNLVPDIFMVLYENVLKKSFLKCGGFHEFLKYINDPKYLKKKCIVRNISYYYDHNASVKETVMLRHEIVSGKEKEDKDVNIDFDFMGVEGHELSLTLAKKVLEIAKPNLLPKPIGYGLNPSLSYLCPQAQIGKKPEFLEAVDKGNHYESTPERHQSLSSYSKTNDDAVDDTSRYEAIIESVIRHNNSINSSHVKSKNPIQMEVSRNLEQMKSMLNFLIQVLEEHDKE